MVYREFQDLKLSALGMGAMRLPVLDGDDSRIDEAAAGEMVDYAMGQGVNYYDTAWGYHSGNSERAMGKALGRHPRESFYLATKFPGYDLSNMPKVKEIFEKQLEKCQVSYFDFYLFHNVCEMNIDAYLDQSYGIYQYLMEQKENGRIRHLGFSAHGNLDVMKRFLEAYGKGMEFCQIQLNYMDWTLQNAREKYQLLTERNIPVWVMEPVRGGRLAHLTKEDKEKLGSFRPDESEAAWAFRFLQGLPNVKMVLSGMSNMEQMEDNVKTFREEKPLSEEESRALMEIAEGMKNSVPCTACRYCCDGCPKGLDIPMLLATYNEVRFLPAMNARMRIDALPEEKRPAACIACGKCSQICPQGINIPKELKDFAAALKSIPSWEEICRQRDAAKAALAGKEK